MACFHRGHGTRSSSAIPRQNLGTVLNARRSWSRLSPLPQGHRTRPESTPHINLGLAHYQGSWTRPSPLARPSNSTRSGSAHRNLGNALKAQGSWTGHCRYRNYRTRPEIPGPPQPQQHPGEEGLGPGNCQTQLRDPKRAVGASMEAVELAPCRSSLALFGMGQYRGKLEGQHRGAGEVLQTATGGHGRLRPVDRDVPGPWETCKRKGVAGAGTSPPQSGSPPLVRPGCQADRWASRSQRRSRSSRSGLPR